MPIRSTDIYADVVSTFRKGSNAYVSKMQSAQLQKSLPVAMGPDLKDLPGHWRQKFPEICPSKERIPLVVEVGCHLGHTICDMASSHKDVLFVGVDITFKRVIETAERVKKLGLSNVFVILANAHGMTDLFVPNEVDGYITFFPDPWQKKKHAHNRLYSQTFCDDVSKHLAPGGFVWLKTDHHAYFENACDIMKNSGAFSESESIPIFTNEDYSSVFLRRFENMGLPWYGRKWVKSS